MGKPSKDEQIAMMHDMAHHWDFTVKLVDDAFENPGDNYLGDLVRLHRQDPTLFTRNYCANVMFLMSSSPGMKTTTQASANGLKMLLENREHWEALCKDPALIPNAVEEILRMDLSIFSWRRIATCDTEIRGQKISAGDKISGDDGVRAIMIRQYFPMARHSTPRAVMRNVIWVLAMVRIFVWVHRWRDLSSR